MHVENEHKTAMFVHVRVYATFDLLKPCVRWQSLWKNLWWTGFVSGIFFCNSARFIAVLIADCRLCYLVHCVSAVSFQLDEWRWRQGDRRKDCCIPERQPGRHKKEQIKAGILCPLFVVAWSIVDY